MAYAPPRIEIYQVLKSLTKALETPLLPFCIIGPVYRVKDTERVAEQFATDYSGSKQTIVFTYVAGQDVLLKRSGVETNLLVYVKSGASPLSDIEIVQAGQNAVLENDTAAINNVGDYSVGDTSIIYDTGASGYGVTNYVGSDNAGEDFYVVFDPGGANEEKCLVTGDTKISAGDTGTLTLAAPGLVKAHLDDEVINFIGKEVYYDSVEKVIGNLSSTVMAVVKEGQYVYKKANGTTSYGGVSRANIIAVNTYNNSIMLDFDLEFTPSDIAPGDVNDDFNIFSDVVSVAGYIEPVSPHEAKYVPNDAIGDYTGKIITTGILLPSSIVDNLGSLVTHAAVHSTYTTYAKTLNMSARIVNVPMLMTSIDDVEEHYGEIRPENDLAYGVFLALVSQQAGYAVAVESADLAGYSEALEKIKDVNVYSLVPLTHSNDVISAFKTHVEYMSKGEQSNWRVAIVSGDNSPGTVIVAADVIGTAVPDGGSLSKFIFKTPIAAAINPGDVLRLEDIDSPEISGDYQIVGVDDFGPASSIISVNISTTFYELSPSYTITGIATNVVTIGAHALKVGDIIWLEGLNVVAESGWYKVSVITTTTITITTIADAGVSLTSTSGVTVTKDQVISGDVFYVNTPYSIAIETKNFGISLGSRRTWNIFPDLCMVEEPDVLPGYFASASYAGMVGGTPGPLPYTEENVPSITKVYGSSDIMGYDHLNIAAEGGNTILYNAGVGGLPTIRDQLSTDMSSSLTMYHSVTVNVDFISYTLRAHLEPLKGKHNINQDLIDAAKVNTIIALDYFKQSVGGNRINSYTDPVLSVVDGCVIVKSELTIPIPGNVIKVMLNLTA